MLKKYWYKIALLAIIIFAIFFRTYHFSDWLHFGMDQARDATLVSQAAAEGPAQLPLLGPRAGGTYVRLGPIFYYFQYLSAKITDSTDPTVFAIPDLIFSILTIPLLFLFLRLFFSRSVSLLATALYAFNFVIIQFSRFAWNPNSIPFWTLLAFYALFRSIGEKDGKKRYLWIFLVAISWAVVGQLHFVALAAVPAVILFFLLWSGKWRAFKWKEAVLLAIILIIFFAPVILSDIVMKGDNLKQFFWAFQYKPQEHSFLGNIKTDILMHANYYTLILTTYVSPTGKASLAAGAILSLFGLGYLIYNLRREKDEDKKNFLKLIFIWVAVSFLVLIPFAFQIKPRFLFFEIFIPFIFVAMGIEWLQKGDKYKKFVSFAAIALVVGVIALNIEATLAWFARLETGQKFSVWGDRLSFMQYPKAITASDFREATEFVDNKWQENPAKIYFYGNLELRNPLLYLLEQKNPKIEYEYIGYRTRDFFGRYFAVSTAGGGLESLPKHYQAKFDLAENNTFKKLAVQELKLKEIQPKESEKESLKEPKVESETEQNAKKGIKKSDRVLWGDLFSKK
ncbi:MAG: glycosyltransferase family 39 protein [Parcubacteria group bacterium]|jgi:4-amino-4-deoxy-L-arabinose transferase-like glycosyltransferase